MLDTSFKKGYPCDSLASVVMQVVEASFMKAPTTMPFRPNDGINLDQYLFEPNDAQLEAVYLNELSDVIKLQHSAINSVSHSRCHVTIKRPFPCYVR